MFSSQNFFFKLGIGSELLELIAIVAVLAGIVFLFWKLKSWVFLILGLLLFGISLTDWVYEKGTVMIAGIALIILWLLIKIFSRKKKEKQEEYISRPTIIRGEDRQPQLEAEKRELERRLRETERLKREAEERAKQKRRSVYDLKQKYLSYLFQYNMARKKPERRKRIKQAMSIIILYAERLGYPKKVFLSKDVAGNSAKSPEELKD